MSRESLNRLTKLGSELDNYINLALTEPNAKLKNQKNLRDVMFPIREDVGKNIAHYIEKLVFKDH